VTCARNSGCFVRVRILCPRAYPKKVFVPKQNGISIHRTIKKSTVTTVATVRDFFDFKP
jgi:hypothetical protein